MDNLIYLATILLSFCGFLISLNILHKKRAERPMVCPLNMKCEQVLYSKYSRFLGAPIEMLGMLYYGVMFFCLSIILFYPSMNNPLLVIITFMTAVCGFTFSMYLTSVQIIKLKEFCSWCLMSAVTSTLIFILLSQTNSLSSGIAALTWNYRALLIIIYSLATTIGLVVSVVMEALFIRLLQESRASENETSLMHHLRQATWLCLGIMAVSNYAIYIMAPSEITSSKKFLVKILALAILLAVNAAYDLLVSSRLLEALPRDRADVEGSSPYLRNLSFVFGPASIMLWFLILALELTKKF